MLTLFHFNDTEHWLDQVVQDVADLMVTANGVMELRAIQMTKENMVVREVVAMNASNALFLKY